VAMPNYKGHIAGGIITFVLFCFIMLGLRPSFFIGIEWLFFTIAGALFPDVDIKSKGQKYFYWFVFLFFMILTIKECFEIITGLAFIIIIPMLVRHRGIFHSPRFVIIIPLIAWVVVSSFFPTFSMRFLYDIIFFIAGALSHLVLDFGLKHMMRRLLKL